MSTVFGLLAANPAAAATVFGATSLISDVGRRGAIALLGKGADLARAAVSSARRARYRRRLRSLTTAAGVPVPWREPGYGLARALGEPAHIAARAHLAEALTRTEQGEQ